MAQQKFGITFDTDGFKKATEAINKTALEFDKALGKSQKAVEEAVRGQQKALETGDKNAADVFAKNLENSVKKSNRIIQQSYRELGVKSSQSLKKQKAQAISAYEAIAISGVASARDLAEAQKALEKQLKRIDDQLEVVEGQTRRTGQGFDYMKAAVAGFLGAAAFNAFNKISGAAQNLWQNILRAGQVTENLRAQLLTLTGSEQAVEGIYQNLLEFAKTTTFQIPEVVEAYIKLANRGLAPTNEELRKMGDFAASQGKPLIQVVEAILDASQGANERLTELGINAQKSGGQVTQFRVQRYKNHCR